MTWLAALKMPFRPLHHFLPGFISQARKAQFTKPAAIRTQVQIPIRGATGEFCSFTNLGDSGEHFAVGFGNWARQQNPLVRIHSECLTGDVFGSMRCDCGNQLSEAVDLLNQQDGILIYLRQEGRGIGLYNKFSAYELQAAGYDTYAANRALGFADDLRDYRPAAKILQALGKSSVRLLTNNPDKVAQLERFGIAVSSRISTGIFSHAHNRRYLQTKKIATGHHIAFNLTGEI
jgi:GTP cyclohydrolase II